jgi:UDP-N-acetylmuramate: L-alanyl-gamma-D-glutamyl-meso-diaminopimelate ligase
MKLGAMKALLADSLTGADLVYCHAGAIDWDATEVLAPLGLRAQVLPDVDSVVAAVARDAREGDQVLVMSNGGFGGIHGKLLAALAQSRTAVAADGADRQGEALPRPLPAAS